MQLAKIILLASALATSPVLAIPPIDKHPNSYETRATPSPKRAPKAVKTGNDFEKIISATTMVNSYIDRVSLYGNKATQPVISAALSYFQDLITAFREASQENITTPPQAFSDSEKFTLCTTVWNLIYKERNLAQYIGTVDSILARNGFGPKMMEALDMYQDQTSKFFNDLISRLDVCQSQLNYGLEDLTDTITIAESSLTTRIKAVKQESTKQDSKNSKKPRKNGLWGRDLE